MVKRKKIQALQEHRMTGISERVCNDGETHDEHQWNGRTGLGLWIRYYCPGIIKVA